MRIFLQGRDYVVQSGLLPQHRKAEVQGYWNAFSRKLRFPLGPERKAITYLDLAINSTHAIPAVSSNGILLGVAGFKTKDGAFVQGDLRTMAKIYGWLKASPGLFWSPF